MKTGAEPAAVEEIARAKRWAQVDPQLAPGDPPTFLVGGKSYGPTHGWTFVEDRTTFWLSLIDTPSQPNLRYCSLMAYNLDARAVDAGFMFGIDSDGPPELAGLPVKKYSFQDYPGAATYLLGGAPDKVVHSVSFIPEKSLGG